MPESAPSINIEQARAYLRAIESGETDGLAAFFRPDVEQTEFPNRMTQAVTTSRLPDLIAGSKRGKAAMRSQTYDIRNAAAIGDTVLLEVTWSAELAVAIGTLPAGGTMRAYIAIILEFENGLITSQRNYDCYEPF